jgi:hypothetical protein
MRMTQILYAAAEFYASGPVFSSLIPCNIGGAAKLPVEAAIPI